ncbi:MAG TPA: hypothetical protein VF707_03875 [Ardenticatenaceae bacterium]
MNCGTRLPDTQQATVAIANPPPTAPQASAPSARPQVPNPAPVATPAPAVGQLGSAGTAAVSIWGPFAGYGTRGRHVAWLLNDLHEQAETLRDAVLDRFTRRQIPKVRVTQETLTRQGIIADRRPYFLVRRDRATAGLYIARFGRDLYISQVTYYKGPISNVRILVVLALIGFVILYPPVYSAAWNAVNADPFSGLNGLGTVMWLTCFIGPLYLMSYVALGLIAIFTLYKWLTEKDWMAAFRVPPNEFDVDDMVSLEKSVEQTVREGLDMVGIEQRLMPPAAEYGPRRRLI